MPVSIGYSVDTKTALKNLDTTELITGYIRSVRDEVSWFMYNSTSTATPDDATILLPTSGVGRWIKLFAQASVSSSSIVDLSEAIDDRVAALLVAGTSISIVYNDAANTLTLNVTNNHTHTSSQITDFTEAVQDTIGGTFVDTSTIDFTYNDTANTMSLAVQNDSITNTHISSSAAIAQSKVANLVSDLAGKANSIHTHTSVDITNFNEAVDDRIASLLIAGTNITISYDDTANTLTLSASSSGGSGLGDWDDVYAESGGTWDANYS